MRFWLTLPALSILGVVCGFIVGRLNTVFITNCGESCPDDPFLWALGCLIAFPVIGYVILRRVENRAVNVLLVATGLAVLTILPALAFYSYDVHKRYWDLYNKQANTDVEYSRMVIAEKAIPSLGIAEAERCAINETAICDKKPRVITALCQSGFVTITQQHWSSFKRLPAEDLRGLLADEDYKNFPKNVCPD